MLQSVELKDLGLSLAESLGHDFVNVVGYNELYGKGADSRDMQFGTYPSCGLALV